MGLIAEITHENEKQMLNFGDIAASFNEVVCKMNPDIEYELSADAFDNINLSRIKIGLNKIKPFTFTKTGEFLEFDWKTNAWENQRFLLKDLQASPPLAFSLPAAFAFAFLVLTSFAENQIQIVEKSCNNKIVKIDGKKYKLIAI